MKMSKLVDQPSRSETLKFLAETCTIGSLGLFIGAGFPKAFVQGANKPLSWEDLLKKACDYLEIDFAATTKNSNGYPDQASKICAELSRKNSCTYGEAVMKFKIKVAQITNWLPQPHVGEEIGNLLLEIDPSWIITTNYDFVIESMLPDKGVQLSPSDTFVAPKDQIPIFHLHGHRLKPDSIVITQEDYVVLSRPTDYRQVRLPLKFKESTVLTLGYGIGDQNVLTAMDWAQNVYTSTTWIIAAAGASRLHDWEPL